MKRFIQVLVAVALGGCANPYAQFYNQTVDAKSLPSYVPSSEPLKIYTTSDFPKDVDALIRKSYTPVGNSSFNAASNKVSESQPRQQAASVSAEVVLIKDPI
jgi:hypothetical protein